MDFKKCTRCGSFFVSSNNVCCNCEIKDKLDISKVSNYINDDNEITSISELSTKTGISVNNLNRFIENSDVPGLDIKL